MQEDKRMKETKTLEFKSDISNSFLKTVSAFANFQTGVIEFGVNDDGTICGVSDPEETCLNIENKINDSISPKPDYTLRIRKKEKVVVLTVKEGRYKPYLYRGKAYKRYDTATVEVDSIELRRITLEGSNLYYEGLAGNTEDPQFHYLEQKLIEKLGISALTDDMLRTFGFYTDDGRINIAGELFADKNTFSGTDIVRFGRSINEIMERNTFSGISILEQYDESMTVFRRYYQYEVIKGFERTGVEMIPEEAFREAIANALIHRTWDVSSHIRISMFSDRIEIASPGGLPYGVSEEEYLDGNVSYLRNPTIANLFFRMHYIEMFGTGIARIKEAYTGSQRKPQFVIRENSITVILPVISEISAVTAEEQNVLDLLKPGYVFSSSEIAEKLGWTKDKTVRTVNALTEKGYLQKTGNGRGTRYSVS